MKPKTTEKRENRGYKIADTPYFKAMRRAERNGKALATLIEQWVVAYAKEGWPNHEGLFLLMDNNTPVLAVNEQISGNRGRIRIVKRALECEKPLVKSKEEIK